MPQRPGHFTVIGPGGGGAMYNPTFSPHDPKTVLVNCDMTGGYISHDGGDSWRMFNLRGTIRFFVFDPKVPSTIYAQATGLWRTTDTGQTWKLVWPRPSTVTGINMNSDHADETIESSANPLGLITALAIDPRDSKTLVASAKNGADNALFVSHDAGDSWTRETDLTETPRRVYIEPRTPADVYVAGPHGVNVRTAGQWQQRPAPTSTTFTDISAGFRKSGAPIFYATSEQGAFVSRDGAKTWTPIQLPGAGAEVRAVATSLHHPETAYLSYRQLTLDGKKWLGVATTRDAGATWSLAWKDSTVAAPNVHDNWITPALGTDWGENPLTLGAADQDPKLAFGTDLGRTMRTTDGGATWTGVYSQKVPGAAWTTTGLDVTTNYSYHFDPFDSKRRFITYTDIGLSRSEDGGRSWTRSVEGAPERWTNTTYWIAFDPTVNGRMWAAMSGTHDLPRPKMFRRTLVTSYRGGIARSDDGGKTWKASNTGMPETAPTHILVDASSPADHRVLYVAAFGRGVYKSTDGGAHWTLANQGIAQNEPFAWRLTQSPDGTLYVVIARRSEHGEIGDANDGAIYRSTDGAATWQPVALPEGTNGPNGIAIDPNDPKRLYLAAWARAKGLHGEGGGIFVSSDAGSTWRNVLHRDQHVYDVTIDARDTNVLYACGFESSAWRSSDRGEHWSRISGFNFKWGHRVIPDPEDPAQIYITTFGGSLWHGRFDAPAQFLDIATPELDPAR